MTVMRLRDFNSGMGALTTSNTGLPGAFKAAPVVVGKARLPSSSLVSASSRAATVDPCVRYQRAVADGLPAAIVSALKAKCPTADGPKRAIGKSATPLVVPKAPSEMAPLPEPIAAPPAAPAVAPSGSPASVGGSYDNDYGYDAYEPSDPNEGSGGSPLRRASYDGGMVAPPSDGIPKWAAIGGIALVALAFGYVAHARGVI